MDPGCEGQLGSRAVRHALRQGGFPLASAPRCEKKRAIRIPTPTPTPRPLPFLSVPILPLLQPWPLRKLAKADRNCVGISGRGLMWKIKSRLYPYIISF